MINGSLRLGQLWRLSAGIDNLFDRAYSEHLNRPAAPTSVIRLIRCVFWNRAVPRG